MDGVTGLKEHRRPCLDRGLVFDNSKDNYTNGTLE